MRSSSAGCFTLRKGGSRQVMFTVRVVLRKASYPWHGAQRFRVIAAAASAPFITSPDAVWV
ncbi:MAG TPA: hypothetical protein VF981_01330 [Gemmatimonadaceae bacterium]